MKNLPIYLIKIAISHFQNVYQRASPDFYYECEQKVFLMILT